MNRKVTKNGNEIASHVSIDEVTPIEVSSNAESITVPSSWLRKSRMAGVARVT